MAMQNPNVCLIGHPTGRLINRRDPMDIDMVRIIEAAAQTGTALEINASWQRLDLKDLHIRQALESDVALSINTDAHRTVGLETIHFGVTTARRGGAPAEAVLNTWPIKKLKTWIEKKRSAGVTHG